MSKLCQEIAAGMPAADTEREILRYFELHRRGDGIEVPHRALDRRAHRARLSDRP
jgi:hypothetical protein